MELAFKSNRFHMVILDDDFLEFSFVGPMSNDTKLAQYVLDCALSNRHFTIDGPVNDLMDRDTFIAQVSLRSGYTWVSDVFEIRKFDS